MEITTAISGKDAMEKINEADFDLVLLDLRMPSGTEGFDVLTKIKNLKPQTEVIMISAYGDIRKTNDAYKLGARRFIPKEDDFNELIEHEIKEFLSTAHLIADRELLIESKYKEVKTEKNTNKKGKALEELLSALFASVDGFTCISNVHTKSEEIDVVVTNDELHPSWRGGGRLILVECKNWSKKAGKDEIVLFKEKVGNRKGECKYGFFVSIKGFANTFTLEVTINNRKESQKIIQIDDAKLKELIASKNRGKLLREFADKAALM
jgi:CheY-like chemotaxis protein